MNPARPKLAFSSLGVINTSPKQAEFWKSRNQEIWNSAFFSGWQIGWLALKPITHRYPCALEKLKQIQPIFPCALKGGGAPPLAGWSSSNQIIDLFVLWKRVSNQNG